MRNTKVSLNDHYNLYSAGLLEKENFEVLIFKTIREEVQNTNLSGWEEEDCDDYMSWLYPRISKAIDTYRETGASFEAYIGTMVRLTVKEYVARRSRNYVTESVAWNMSVFDMHVSDREPEYECGVEKKTGIIESAQNPRQLLILVLKCCNYISADFLDRISSRLGMESEELNGMINVMKENRAERIKKIELLREKANCLFCRCMVYERRLSSMTSEAAVMKIREKLERGRGRLAKLRLKLSRLRPDPSNAQIARLLGLSKGTVDASLFSIKKKFLQN